MISGICPSSTDVTYERRDVRTSDSRVEDDLWNLSILQQRDVRPSDSRVEDDLRNLSVLHRRAVVVSRRVRENENDLLA